MRFVLRNSCGTALLVATLGWVASGSATAAPGATVTCPSPTPIALTRNLQPINHGVEALLDPERNYSLEQVTGASLCTQFKPVHGIPYFGYVGGRAVAIAMDVTDRASVCTALDRIIFSSSYGCARLLS